MRPLTGGLAPRPNAGTLPQARCPKGAGARARAQWQLAPPQQAPQAAAPATKATPATPPRASSWWGGALRGVVAQGGRGGGFRAERRCRLPSAAASEGRTHLLARHCAAPTPPVRPDVRGGRLQSSAGGAPTPTAPVLRCGASPQILPNATRRGHPPHQGAPSATRPAVCDAPRLAVPEKVLAGGEAGRPRGGRAKNATPPTGAARVPLGGPPRVNGVRGR